MFREFFFLWNEIERYIYCIYLCYIHNISVSLNFKRENRKTDWKKLPYTCVHTKRKKILLERVVISNEWVLFGILFYYTYKCIIYIGRYCYNLKYICVLVFTICKFTQTKKQKRDESYNIYFTTLYTHSHIQKQPLS